MPSGALYAFFIALIIFSLSSPVSFLGSFTSVFFGFGAITVVWLHDLNLFFSFTETPTTLPSSIFSIGLFGSMVYENSPVSPFTVASTGLLEFLSTVHFFSLQNESLSASLSFTTI